MMRQFGESYRELRDAALRGDTGAARDQDDLFGGDTGAPMDCFCGDRAMATESESTDGTPESESTDGTLTATDIVAGIVGGAAFLAVGIIGDWTKLQAIGVILLFVAGLYLLWIVLRVVVIWALGIAAVWGLIAFVEYLIVSLGGMER